VSLAFAFVLTFCAIEITSAVLPYEPRLQTEGGLAMHYLAACCVVAALALGLPPRLRGPVEVGWPTNRLQTTLRCLEVMSIVGLLVLVANVMFVQSVSYAQGIAAAREAMRVLRESRGGDFSALSFLGNLLASGSYLAVALAVVSADAARGSVPALVRQWLVVLCLCLLTGGREPAWIALGVTVGACALRVASGLRTVGPRLAPVLVAMVLLATVFALAIARLRIDGYDGAFDLDGYVGFLGGERKPGASESISVTGPAGPVLAYLAHTRWLSIETFSGAEGEGIATMRVLLATLSPRQALNFLAPGTVVFHGKWIPATASVWYDGGWFGLGLLCAAFHLAGLAFGRARKRFLRSGSPECAMAAALVGCLVFTAPMQFAFESIPFMYAVLLLGFLWAGGACLRSLCPLAGGCQLPRGGAT
jgi:hypothetical protein